MTQKQICLLSFVLLCLSGCLYSQSWSGIIDPSRAIDWSTAGVPGGIPNRTTVCASISASTYGNGSSDATTAINSALSSCPGGQAVSLSSGTFLIKGNLRVPSDVTLRGAGANQTILNAKGTSGDVIMLGDSGDPDSGGSVSITSGATVGSTSITISSASGISVGDYLIITELNDSSFVTNIGSEGTCTWCDGGIGWNGTRAAGQIVEVKSISGNTVGISPGLYMTYSKTPLATPFSAKAKYAGVEDLQVYANNTGYSDSFEMNMCAYCWVSGVEDNYTDGDHVDLDWGYHDQIQNSYFSNAYLHTPGSSDSDIALRNKTSASLVQNNILERLHVSIMLEWGAAGNVISYNYMFGNFDVSATNVLMYSLDTHGAHPMFNLWEGNVGAQLHPDSTWGSSSDNTAFRNWMTGTTKICNPTSGRGTVNCSGSSGWWAIQANRAMDIDYLATSTNLIGDVVGSLDKAHLTFYNNGTQPLSQVNMVVAVCGPSPCGPGSRSYDAATYDYSIGYGEASDDGSSGYDSLAPYSTLFLHGDYNDVTKTVTWANSVTHTLPASFYLSSKPSWFGNTPWPAIGPDVSGGLSNAYGHAYAIPAQVCYENVMGGTDGTGSPLNFNANVCYQGSSRPEPPTNLSAVPH